MDEVAGRIQRGQTSNEFDGKYVVLFQGHHTS